MTTETLEATQAPVTCAADGQPWPCETPDAPGHRASKPAKPSKKWPGRATQAPVNAPAAPQPETRATGYLSRLASLLERIYAVMQGHHPDLPDVMFIVGVGTRPDREGMTFGHFGAARWQFPKERMPELMISGEGLERGPRELLNTLLHEAGGHGLAMVRKIEDTSRGGRYHNRKFAALAAEVGLTPPEAPSVIGFSNCTLPDATWDKYADVHELLEEACRVYRHGTGGRGSGTAAGGAQGAAGASGEGDESGDAKTSGKRVKATCKCGRSQWMSRSVLVQAPAVCVACWSPFIAVGVNEDHVELFASVLAVLGEAAQAALTGGAEE